jgi:bifunctional DNA-binding transcriptional regulator/antitoxin component of YhaV-PrlF toxin-antitoxin module
MDPSENQNEKRMGAPLSNASIRRSEDFKRTFVDNFNISISEDAFEISIISDSQFGAVNWARDNLGIEDPGSADIEVVEESQLIITPKKTQEFLRILTQSFLKKKYLDEIAQKEGEIGQQQVEEATSIAIDPETFGEYLESLEEEVSKDDNGD